MEDESESELCAEPQGILMTPEETKKGLTTRINAAVYEARKRTMIDRNSDWDIRLKVALYRIVDEAMMTARSEPSWKFGDMQILNIKQGSSVTKLGPEVNGPARTIETGDWIEMGFGRAISWKKVLRVEPDGDKLFIFGGSNFYRRGAKNEWIVGRRKELEPASAPTPTSESAIKALEDLGAAFTDARRLIEDALKSREEN